VRRGLYGGVAGLNGKAMPPLLAARCVGTMVLSQKVEADPLEALSPEVLEDLRHGRATRERKMAVCTGGAHLNARGSPEILRFSPETQTKWSPPAHRMRFSRNRSNPSWKR